MSKLLQLKPWLTLPEAGKYLATVFGEPVCEGDLLQLALNGRLDLSIVFTGPVIASVGRPVADSEFLYEELPNLEGKGTVRVLTNGYAFYSLTGQGYLFNDEKITRLDGDEAYDVPLLSGDLAILRNRYWSLSNIPNEELFNIDGIVVSRRSGRFDGGATYFRLLDRLPSKKGQPASYFPIIDFPECSVLVVKTSRLLEFSSPPEKVATSSAELMGKARTSVLQLVGGLLMDAYRMDIHADRLNGISEVQNDLARVGVTMDDKTLRRWIKEAAQVTEPPKPKL